MGPAQVNGKQNVQSQRQGYACRVPAARMTVRLSHEDGLLIVVGNRLSISSSEKTLFKQFFCDNNLSEKDLQTRPFFLRVCGLFEMV
jgi:hypothetical protein